MDLKEIVNLRKLREYYENTLEAELCEYCPCRTICDIYDRQENSYTLCIIEKMLDMKIDNKDLYELEADGKLTEDYQIEVDSTLTR